MRLSTKYRSRKFLRFPEAITLQLLQLNCFVRGVEKNVGLHTLLDAPSQFLELWICPPCGER